MNVAFLFNSDHSELGTYYGFPIIKSVLKTGVLQSSKRSMRISIGDVLTYSYAIKYRLNHTKLCLEVYKPDLLNQLNTEKLKGIFNTATIYCLLFENMGLLAAQEMHKALSSFAPYLGSMDVKFSNPIHLHFFREYLVESYRLECGKVSLFYSMGNEDGGVDLEIQKLFEQSGFSTKLEDIGARRTIFDNFGYVKHFERIDSFEKIFTSLFGSNIDTANIVYYLEELHPKLFDVLSAAARTLDRAETEEDFAQAALSGRRFLEQFADYLFPAQDKPFRGRQVGKTQYKNRIWAYITIECEKTNSNSITEIGKETDRLVNLFNAGLHAIPSKEKVQKAFCDLVKWIADIIQINPSSVRKPYLAYENELNEFLNKILNNHSAA